uniref:Uncharacterized protein n=1 Tax=Haptolina ericina TaxID=156174 RepID=A0A7S3AIQ8_9EUKA
MDIDTCLLRYLLAPRLRLNTLAERALGEKLPLSGLALGGFTATHVRLGDSVFQNAEWTKHGWRHSADSRNNPFARHVEGSLRCLMRSSEIGRDCMPCVLVSDSELVERCAVEALDSPIIPSGVPVHILASESGLASTEANIDKIFTDWWLLARALVSVDWGVGSAFSRTATAFKLASSSSAVVVTPNASRAGGLAPCNAHRLNLAKSAARASPPRL